MAVEAFLAVEVIFREEVAVSLEVTAVFPAVAAVSLGAAVFLAAAEVLCPAAAAVFLLVTAAAFLEGAVIFRAGAASAPRDHTVLRTTLHCSPISADRDRVAVESHRVQPELNQAAVVPQWEEARHSCPPATDRVAIWEVGPRNFPLAMKAAKEHVQVRFHPSARTEATPAIFSASPAESGPAPRSVGQSRIGQVNFPRIVPARVNSRFLLSNAQIGPRAR
jgi:hypothetical protein